MRVELVDCPECGLPADVVDDYELYSTDGPVRHLSLVCVARHRFTVLPE